MTRVATPKGLVKDSPYVRCCGFGYLGASMGSVVPDVANGAEVASAAVVMIMGLGAAGACRFRAWRGGGAPASGEVARTVACRQHQPISVICRGLPGKMVTYLFPVYTEELGSYFLEEGL